MTPLLWAGLAVAVPLAAWWLWCLRPSQWREINKRIDAANARAEAKIRADELERHVTDALDVVAEPDHAKAEHMNRTLRRAEGGDEHG